MVVARAEFNTAEGAVSPFQAGFIDGRDASLRKEPLRPYLRVGLDDYARGFRSGFFARESAPSSLRPSYPSP